MYSEGSIHRRIARVCVVLTVALAALQGLSGQVRAGERVMIVVDGSGSMAARMDGESRISVARRVVARAAERWRGSGLDAGLIAYGHRSKSYCGDIELLLAPRAVAAGAFDKALGRVDALGRTPIADALRTAAEALDYRERAATVVLISDGLENCGRDPCALARSLAREAAGLTAHVIGLGLDETEDEKLQCIAEATGGRFVTANDARQLFDALAATAEPELQPEPEPEPRTQRAELWLPSLEPGTYELVIRLDGGLTVNELRQSQLRDTGPQRRTARHEELLDRPGEFDGIAVDRTPRISEEPVQMRLSGPRSVFVGERFRARLDGPNAFGGRLMLQRAGDRDCSRRAVRTIAVTGTRIEGLGEVQLMAPGQRGAYELQYCTGTGSSALARHLLTVRERASGIPDGTTDVGEAGEGIGGHAPRRVARADAAEEWSGALAEEALVEESLTGEPVESASRQEEEPPRVEREVVLEEEPLAESHLPDNAITDAIPAEREPAGRFHEEPLPQSFGDEREEAIQVSPVGEDDGLARADKPMRAEPLAREFGQAPVLEEEVAPVLEDAAVEAGPTGEDLATAEILEDEPLHQETLDGPGLIEEAESRISLAPIDEAIRLPMQRRGLRADESVITAARGFDDTDGFEDHADGFEGVGRVGEGRTGETTDQPTESQVSAVPPHDLVDALEEPDVASAPAESAIEWGEQAALPDLWPSGETEQAGGFLDGRYSWYRPITAEDVAAAEILREVATEQSEKADPGSDSEYDTFADVRHDNADARLADRSGDDGVRSGEDDSSHTAEQTRPDDLDWVDVAREPMATGADADAGDKSGAFDDGRVAGLADERDAPAAEGFAIHSAARAPGTQVAMLPRISREVVGPKFARISPVKGGYQFNVAWETPSDHKDWVAIGRPEQSDENYMALKATRGSGDMRLRAPTEPGQYEVRYISSRTGAVLSRQSFSVISGGVRLVAMQHAEAGDKLRVWWHGPGHTNDVLTLARRGMDDDDYLISRPIIDGNPIVMALPDAPGAYEIRYVNGTENVVMHRRSLAVTKSPGVLFHP